MVGCLLYESSKQLQMGEDSVELYTNGNQQCDYYLLIIV